MRFAHISDLHFSHPNFHPSQFLCKRWLGNFNQLFLRKKEFDTTRLPKLIPLFKEKGVTHVIISGDFSTTSAEKEFVLASSFIQGLQQEGMKTYCLPGNHDHYTKKAYKKKLFYQFFPASFSVESKYNLKDHGVTSCFLGNKLWLIALDTALATSLVSSQGFFSPTIENHLEGVIATVPRDHHIILANHFSLFANEGLKKNLIRHQALRQLLSSHANIKLYLHGHTHRHCIADLRPNRLPIILDPGSASHRKGGKCHLLEISPEGCLLDVYTWGEKWGFLNQHQFKW